MASALLHLVRYRLGWDEAQSQTTREERAAISRHAAGKSRAVEIGVYEGVTTGVIACALAEGATLYGIDPFLVGRLGMCWGKGIAKREAMKSRPRCTVTFVEDFSHVASEKINGSFDFIFVDGDHSWEGIVQDWRDWSPRVNSGGILALHDTIVPRHNPSVANLGSHKYFMEHMQHDPRFEIVEQVDSLSVLRRR